MGKKKNMKMFTSTNISDTVIYLSDVFEREIVRERELNCVFWIKMDIGVKILLFNYSPKLHFHI